MERNSAMSALLIAWSLSSNEICFGVLGDFGTHFDVLAILMFDNLLDVVGEHFGSFCSLCFAEFGEVLEHLIL